MPLTATPMIMDAMKADQALSSAALLGRLDIVGLGPGPFEWMTPEAQSLIEKATDLARRMVCEWGMSEKLGPMTFGKKEEEIFLGRDFTQKVDYSESTAIEIDAEVRRIIQESYHKAKDLLKTNLRLLHKVAESLLEKEVLDGSEIDAIVNEFGGNGGAPLTPSAAAAVA